MKKVTLTISSTSVLIKPIKETFEAESFKSALGLAMRHAHKEMTDQYVDPVVIINGISLDEVYVKALRGGKAKKDVYSYMNFQLGFEQLRSEIMTYFAFQDQQSMVDFVRSTDKNGHYSSVKDNAITAEITAAQAKVVLSKVKDRVTYIKADAELSAMTSEDYQIKADAKDKVAQVKAIKVKLGLLPPPKVKQIAAPKPGKRTKK